MPITRADLISKTMSVLQEAGTGQPIAPEDRNLLNSALDGLVVQLINGGVLRDFDDTDIDPAIFLPLARLLANANGDDYGLPFSEEKRVLQEAAIRRAVMVGPIYSTLATDYY